MGLFRDYSGRARRNLDTRTLLLNGTEIRKRQNSAKMEKKVGRTKRGGLV